MDQRCGTVSVIALFGLWAGVSQAHDRVFDKTFPVQAAGTLDLECDYGSISIQGTDKDEVSIHVELQGDRDWVDDYAVTAEATANGVKLRGKRDSRFLEVHVWPDTPSARYTITVPRRYALRVEQSRGDYELRRLDGRVYGRHSRGNVTLQDVNGDVQIEASRGNVRLDRVAGLIRARSSRGNIVFQEIDGDVQIDASRGYVHLAHVTGSIRSRSSRGNVVAEVEGANRGINIEAERGNISLQLPEGFAANIKARAERGAIENNLQLTGTEDHSANRVYTLHGTLNGGGKTISLESSRGNISLRR